MADFLVDTFAPELRYEPVTPPHMLDTAEALSVPASLSVLSHKEQTTALPHPQSASDAISTWTPAAIPNPTKGVMPGQNPIRTLRSRPATSSRGSPAVPSAFLLGLSAADVLTSSDSEDEDRRARRRPGWRQEDSDSEESLSRFGSMLRRIKTGRKGLLGHDRAGLLATGPQATASAFALTAARAPADPAALIKAEPPASASAAKLAKVKIALPDAVQTAASDALKDSSDTTQQAEAEAEAVSAADKDADGAVQRLTTAEPETNNAHSAGVAQEQELSPQGPTWEEESIQLTSAADQSQDGQEATAQGSFSSSCCAERTWWLETDGDSDAESDADYFSMPLPWAESQAADQAAPDAEPLAAAGVQESGLPLTMGPAAATGQAEGAVGLHAAVHQAAATAAEAVLQLGDLQFGSISQDDLLAAERAQQRRRDLGDAASLPAATPLAVAWSAAADVGTAMANQQAPLQRSNIFQFGSISREDLLAAEQRQLSNLQFGSIVTEDVMIAEQRQPGSRHVGGVDLPPAATPGVVVESAADVGTVVATPEALPQLGDVSFGSITHEDLVAAEQRQLGRVQFGSITTEDLLLAEQNQHGNRDLGGAILPRAAAPPVLTAVQASPGADVDTAVANADTAVVSHMTSSPTAVGAEVTATALAPPSMPAVSPPASEQGSSLDAAARVSDTQAAAASGGSGDDAVSELREEGSVEEGRQAECDEEDVHVSGHDDGGVEHMGMLQHDSKSDAGKTMVDTSLDYAASLADHLLTRMEAEAGGRGDQIKALSKYPLYRLTCVTCISACLNACWSPSHFGCCSHFSWLECQQATKRCIC